MLMEWLTVCNNKNILGQL